MNQTLLSGNVVVQCLVQLLVLLSLKPVQQLGYSNMALKLNYIVINIITLKPHSCEI